MINQTKSDHKFNTPVEKLSETARCISAIGRLTGADTWPGLQDGLRSQRECAEGLCGIPLLPSPTVMRSTTETLRDISDFAQRALDMYEGCPQSK